jgi:hypothetical protein
MAMRFDLRLSKASSSLQLLADEGLLESPVRCLLEDRRRLLPPLRALAADVARLDVEDALNLAMAARRMSPLSLLLVSSAAGNSS